MFLTAAHPKQTEGSDVRAGTSIDQIYAQRFGDDTPLPSLQLAIENVDAAGTCGYNYACVYSGPISWSSPTTPMPMTIDPRMAFENLFGEGGTAAERAARQRANRSILDGITREIVELRKDLARAIATGSTATSRTFGRSNGVSRRSSSTTPAATSARLPTAPIGVPDSWEEHVKLMFDLQVLAFASEVTRVSSFKLSRDTSNRVFPESGVKTPFHCDVPSRVDSVEDPRVREAERLSHVAAAVLPGEAAATRRTATATCWIIRWCSRAARWAIRTCTRTGALPVLLAGHANGQIKGNLHVRCKDETPYANVLLSMLHTLGVDQQSIGDSTGEVAI